MNMSVCLLVCVYTVHPCLVNTRTPEHLEWKRLVQTN